MKHLFFPVFAMLLSIAVSVHAGDVKSVEKIIDQAKSVAKAKSSSQLKIVIPAGNYVFSKPLVLDKSINGTPEHPTIIAGQGKVLFSGGIAITNWKPVSDPAILKQLPDCAQGKVFEANLKELGMDDYGNPGIKGTELFFDSKPMTLSRYPNTGFVKIADVAVLDKDTRGTKGSVEGKFFYSDPEINKWVNEKQPWVSGYWFYDWSEKKQEIAKIDVQKNYMELKQPYDNYGYRKGQWFFGFNLLCELDSPGEYYIDREAGILYFYAPTDNLDQLKRKLSYLTNAKSILIGNGLSNVKIGNIKIEGCREIAVEMNNCTNIVLKKLVICNSGDAGIIVRNGEKGVIDNCELFGLGAAGIRITAGNRKLLVPGDWTVQNCYIHNYARIARVYNPGIGLNGVGLTAKNNLITDAPHNAILYSGNDIIMEYNEIARVCTESNDAGAVYSGRNLTMRGNIFRYNYLHDIDGFEKKGCVGIYLDDLFSSCRIEGNIFQRVTRAAMIGGGRDNQIINNIFIDCLPSLHVDARGLGWAKQWPEEWLKEVAEKHTISGIAYDQPPYSTKYPELAAILKGNPAAPEGNVISRNICYKGVWDKPVGFWKASIHPVARPFLTMEDNTICTLSTEKGKENELVGENPLFVNPDQPEQAQFQLKPDSPALKHGFIPIPFDKIGRK